MTDSSITDLRRHVGSLMVNLAESFRVSIDTLARGQGLNTAQVIVLRYVREPRVMRDVAERLHYDASSVTTIVDHLEDHGYVTREIDPRDRRVKWVTITAAGNAVRESLEDELFDSAAALQALDEKQLVELRSLLQLAVAAVNPDTVG